MKFAINKQFSIVLLLLVNSIVFLFPRVGPPAFRYTGSNPETDVLNFGFPFTQLIYDSSLDFPFVFGPLAGLTAILCLLVSTLIYNSVAIIKFFKKSYTT
ncbi:MAG: hypothetical protein RLN83_08580 [Balneola sp.]